MPSSQEWPRRCPACGREHFRNPTPVTVVIVPLREVGGVVLVRRLVPPAQGQLALPGGYVNWGESWQQAGAREVWEETGLKVNPDELRLLDAVSVGEGSVLLFCQSTPVAAADLEEFVPNSEVSEIVVTKTPLPLAFATHTKVLQSFLEALAR